MILKFFVNDEEVEQFFTGCGYECRMVEGGRFVPSYHNQSKWVESEKLMVMAGSRQVGAQELLSETIKAKMLSTDLGSKLAIKKAINQIK